MVVTLKRSERSKMLISIIKLMIKSEVKVLKRMSRVKLELLMLKHVVVTSKNLPQRMLKEMTKCSVSGLSMK